MGFTRYHSFQDILAYPRMREYLSVFFSENNLALFPESVRALPLALAERQLESPWNEPFSEVTGQLLDAAHTVLDITERRARRCISLWESEKDWTLEGERRGGKDSVFLLAPEFEKKAGVSQMRPAVIICPGGGYERVCFSGEGNPVMRFMEAKGYVAFVLKYRVAPERYPAPQEDLALAVRYVREHAQEYGADPENVLLMGFSAGGHLCASLGCLYREIAQMLEQETGEKVFPDSLRPDKLCLAYPVITFGEECHEGSFAALTGGDERLRKPLSLEHRVTVDFPETFLWACEDDGCVPPSNTMRMAAALKNVGARHEMRLYPSGGHGCNLAFGSSAYAWTQQLLEFFQQLPQSIG